MSGNFDVVSDRCPFCGNAGRDGHKQNCPKWAPPTVSGDDGIGAAASGFHGLLRTEPQAPATVLTTDSAARKNIPVYSGVLAYFPLAIAEIAALSKAGNDKHNPGQPLHWSRGKSNDHKDCIARHLLEAGTIDPDDGHRHSTKLAWRALANLQIELEQAAKDK